MFHELYKKMDLSRTQIVALDAGYKTPGVVREIFKSGKIPAVPYTRPMTKDGFFRKSEYVYDEYFDCYLCPQNQIFIENTKATLVFVKIVPADMSKNKTSRAPCLGKVFGRSRTLAPRSKSSRHCLRYTNYRGKSQSASRSYFLLPQFEKVGKEKAPKLYIFLLPSFLLTEIKAKSSSQIIPKRALSTV